jgi:hypothetical protein
MRPSRSLSIALLSLALAAPAAARRDVRLNEVQVLGSHNSYHVQPTPDLIQFYTNFNADAIFWEYTHRPLDEQFDLLGIRQIELDIVVDDPQGGRYAEPLGPIIFYGEDIHLPEHDVPGFKVIHQPDLDFVSRCTLFVECLEILRDWSDANPGHLPILVLVELKDDPPPAAFLTQPLPFGPAELDQIDAEIRSVFSEDHILTPDDVRGARATLREAIQKDGWPTLRAARGQVLFALDNGGSKRDLYVAGHPSLAGRVLFTDSPPSSPEAAFAKRNDPIGQFFDIRDLVSRGFIVRTRADADTVEARTGDTTMRDAALDSGAQFVSTDYPELGPFGTDYIVELPGGEIGRCDPVNGPSYCRNDLLDAVGVTGRGVAGRTLIIEDHVDDPSRRRISIEAGDLAVAAPLAGMPDDPRIAGATLTLANPETGERAEFFLPPGPGWQTLWQPEPNDGFVYRDSLGLAGPCIYLMVRNATSIAARCTGAAGDIPFTLDEPSQGAIDVTLQLGAAPLQCMHFGGTVNSDTSTATDDSAQFFARLAPAVGCPE